MSRVIYYVTITGELFRRAVAAKLENFHATGQLTHPIWDPLIFRKVLVLSGHGTSFLQLCFQVQALLGGKVENIACGSAPVSAKCLNFIRIALACKVYEGEYCFRYIYAPFQ